MKCLLEDEEYEKAAAICIFQLNVSRALEVLNEGLQQARREDLGTLILALVGFIRSTTNNDEKNLLNDYSAVTKLFQRPYIRAMFAFILTQDYNDLQYDCVLVRSSLLFSFLLFRRTSFQNEQIDLSDKVAFAARYLNELRLYEKLDKLAEESREKGDLQGILLTGNRRRRRRRRSILGDKRKIVLLGLRQNGCELIQKYLDQSNDIRTAALLAIYVPEDVFQEFSYVQEWIEG